MVDNVNNIGRPSAAADLSREMQRVMEARGWSLRQAERQTGVKYGTLYNMLRGVAVGGEYAVRWARAIGEDPRHWLQLNGKEPEVFGLEQDGEGQGFVMRDRGTAGYGVDPLRLVGPEVPIAPFAEALSKTARVGAGIQRLTDATTAPGEAEEETLVAGPLRSVRVSGNCMEPMYHDGDILFVQPPSTVVDGDVVIALVDYQFITCKAIRIPPEGASWLEPTNGEGQIPEERFTVVGVVAYRLEAARRART